MNSEKTIINIAGAGWKHHFLDKLAHSKEFPARLRLFHAVRKLWGLELLKFTTASGLQLVLDINDYVQSQIYFYGTYEAESVNLFKKLAADASVIFDIGSHIGQYSLECAQDDITQSKQIFAIEVNPKTFTYLLNNIQVNRFKNMKAVLGAISSDPGILNINIPAYWNMGNTQISESAENNGFDNYLVASFNIMNLLTKYGLKTIDLVKIDVEGHEYGILNNLFEQGIYPVNILFEYVPDIFENAPALITLLAGRGYILKDIQGNSYTGQKEIPERNLWAQKV